MASNWISVEDRLPEFGQPILVARPGRAGEIKVEQAYREVGGWWKVYGSLVKRVSHWMPLPEPPGKEEIADG